MRARRRWVVAAMVLLLGCSAGAAGPTATPPTAVGPLRPSEPFGLTTVVLRAPDDSVALSVPVYDAYEPEARERGLMGRERLPAQTGMVFRFPEPHSGGFWMKDTLIPLSIAYFDADGRVVATMDMEPCTQDPCRSYRPGVAYVGALEVNQGFLDTVGVTRGWRVELPFGLPPAR